MIENTSGVLCNLSIKISFSIHSLLNYASTFHLSSFRFSYADGVFGAMMKVNLQFPLLLQYLNTSYVKNPHTCDEWQVNLVNDGPVTMQLDSQSPKNTVDAAES
ncbi:putative D-Tyr tRNAtyr deacylase-like domain-containing protein [Lupinus albus]|uniref:Putative D-Tyr tRNAtyr deacylase-like domain-containing protein n=1 Tax=Lupinus albus TaxID=3870 RepID=A0A6A4NR89_LUPAL|nr:putative D-Tyr tRNAtyr deacylase-like domain-containing protein [Lupinus albus]